MAGIPLKSGADFYNLEASRMRLHNLGADPTEFGLGQIYYNSSSGNNTSGRARLYTGTGFRSLAFMEDIAAIQEQLDLLTGEVDTSELISNLEDVLNFLNNIKENDGDLMTMLNDKLDKTGGTIEGTTNGPLNINTTNASEIGLSLSINSSKKAWFGYMTGTGAYMYNAVAKRYMGIKDDGSAFLGGNTLLHSGNIGEYKAGGIANLGSPTTDTFADYIAKYAKGANVVINESGAAIGNIGKYESVFNVGTWSGRFGRFIFSVGTNPTLCFQTGNDSGNGWGNKKTIAFTDSNVASAQALKHSNGKVAATATSNGSLSIASENAQSRYLILKRYNDGGILFQAQDDSYTWQIVNNADNGLNLYCYGIKKPAMILNSSGNVTIGGSDLAGSDAKLYVNGDIATSGNAYFNNNKGLAFKTADGTGDVSIYVDNKNNLHLGYHNLKNVRFDTGNVLIGTANDSGQKLLVAGDIGLYNYTNLRAVFPDKTNVNIAGVNSSKQLVINSVGSTIPTIIHGGNVLIGATTDDGTSAKLQVNGSATITATGDNTEILRFRTDRAWAFYQVGSGAGASLQLRALSSGKSFSIGRDDGSQVFSVNTAASSAVVTSDASIFPLSSNTHRLGAFDSRWSWLYAVNGNFSGSVTIAGDLHVKGNIIADKGVSAGGAAEESGEGGGGTGGGAEPYVFTFTPSTTTVSVNHNISSEDVIVQVYEKDATSGKWSVVLVDIEIVDSTRVDLHFGRTETTEHKVVIIG